jgi:hypothetical protein
MAEPLRGNFGSHAFVPVALPKMIVPSAPGTVQTTVVTVYNIGSAAGIPTWNLTSGVPVQITRTGVAGNPPIPPGASGLYLMSHAYDSNATVHTVTARYTLDAGGFDFTLPIPGLAVPDDVRG